MREKKEKEPRNADEVRGQLVLGYDELKYFGIRYSRTQIGRLIKAKKFPQPVSLGENRVAFLRDELIAWLSARPRAA